MKTIWQKIYSFFGFWTYTEHQKKQNIAFDQEYCWKLEEEYDKDRALEYIKSYQEKAYNSYRVLYWCCLPWFKFYRKFDLLRWKVQTR